jgi:hypothetical protein
MKTFVIALLASMVATPAMAQTVYRCGNTYSQTACAQGRAVAIDEAPTAAQQAEARRVAASERRLGEDMHRARLAEERAVQPARAANLGGPPPIARDVTWVAAAPHKKKPKRHANASPTVVEVRMPAPAARQRRTGA